MLHSDKKQRRKEKKGGPFRGIKKERGSRLSPVQYYIRMVSSLGSAKVGKKGGRVEKRGSAGKEVRQKWGGGSSKDYSAWAARMVTGDSLQEKAGGNYKERREVEGKSSEKGGTSTLQVKTSVT